MKTLTFIVVAALSLPAFAQGTATFEILDAKVTSAIADKEAADNKTSFTTGEKAYIWMKVKPSAEGAQLRIKYSLDGNPVWTMDAVPARLGRLWYYKTIHAPGAWKAEIVDDADKVIKELTWTATGDPVASKAAPKGADTTTASETGTSTHFAVVDLKLATEIKDREPVSPGTTFSAKSKVYAWLKLEVKDVETQVKLRWSQGDKAIYTSDPVTVKQAPGWRTWLYKTVETSGAWKVDVLDSEDKVVHSVEFNVN